MDTGDGIVVDLTQAEALVLFDFLSRFEQSGRLNIEHPAEEQALWNVLALIERELAAPFRTDYQHLLQQARHTVHSCDVPEDE